MIRTKNDSLTVVACDGCRRECEESREHAVDQTNYIGWNGLLAIAAAKSAGWEQRLKGRLQQDFCPECKAGT